MFYAFSENIRFLFKLSKYAYVQCTRTNLVYNILTYLYDILAIENIRVQRQVFLQAKQAAVIGSGKILDTSRHEMITNLFKQNIPKVYNNAFEMFIIGG